MARLFQAGRKPFVTGGAASRKRRLSNLPDVTPFSPVLNIASNADET